VRWRLPLERKPADAIDPELHEEVYDSEEGLWGYFVEGAPALLTTNVCALCGLVNGAPCLMHALSFGEAGILLTPDVALRANHYAEVVLVAVPALASLGAAEVSLLRGLALSRECDALARALHDEEAPPQERASLAPPIAATESEGSGCGASFCGFYHDRDIFRWAERLEAHAQATPASRAVLRARHAIEASMRERGLLDTRVARGLRCEAWLNVLRHGDFLRLHDHEGAIPRAPAGCTCRPGRQRRRAAGLRGGAAPSSPPAKPPPPAARASGASSTTSCARERAGARSSRAACTTRCCPSTCRSTGQAGGRGRVADDAHFPLVQLPVRPDFGGQRCGRSGRVAMLTRT
jgi:hypothetical protein